jgi:hypothetical protein
MSSTISRLFAPIRLGILTFGVLVHWLCKVCNDAKTTCQRFTLSIAFPTERWK